MSSKYKVGEDAIAYFVIFSGPSQRGFRQLA